MGTSDLPDMYARGLQAQGLRAYILGKSQVPMLQLICNTFLASCAQAKSSVEWELFISAKPFKFFVSCTTHIHKLEAWANRKFGFYEMRPKFWWCTLYSNPMEEVSHLDYEYHY